MACRTHARAAARPAATHEHVLVLVLVLMSLDLNLGNWSLDCSLDLIVGLGAWVRSEAGLVLFRPPLFLRQQAK